MEIVNILYVMNQDVDHILTVLILINVFEELVHWHAVLRNVVLMHNVCHKIIVPYAHVLLNMKEMHILNVLLYQNKIHHLLNVIQIANALMIVLVKMDDV